MKTLKKIILKDFDAILEDSEMKLIVGSGFSINDDCRQDRCSGSCKNKVTYEGITIETNGRCRITYEYDSIFCACVEGAIL